MRDRWKVGGGVAGGRKEAESRSKRQLRMNVQEKVEKRWNREYDRFEGSKNRRKHEARIRETTREWYMKRGRDRESNRERERETEQESYMQLQLFQLYIFGYVKLGARSMHILNFNTKDACVLMLRQQNNQHYHVINCCFAVEQHAWVTCKQQLIIAMETNACFRKAGKQGLL